MHRACVSAALAILASGCAERELPPRGEVLVVVDTDLPVPAVVTNLRVDLYTEDGARTESRDFTRAEPGNWPSSFSVYTDDETKPHVLLVRLRAYLKGREVPRRSDVPEPGGADGIEREPDPTMTVDRLIRLTLRHGEKHRARIVLRGDCVGIATRFRPAASCIDRPEMTEAIEPPLDDDLRRDPPSVVGTWGQSACPDSAISEDAGDRVCVPGGGFVFGDLNFRPISAVPAFDGRPERIVRFSRFALDRDEVSVARYRSALGRGFVAPRPVGAWEYDDPLEGNLQACTFSTALRGREDFALSCVSWQTARAFCAFEGGDLPTEAQWEYASVGAGRAAKTRYTWGNDVPTCTDAVYARGPLFQTCEALGSGPATLAATRSTRDVTPLGIRGMAGGVQEMTRDSYRPFTDACWTRSPSVDPTCFLPPARVCLDSPDARECRFMESERRSLRGGGWTDREANLLAVSRFDSVHLGDPGQVFYGFRCAYPLP